MAMIPVHHKRHPQETVHTILHYRAAELLYRKTNGPLRAPHFQIKHWALNGQALEPELPSAL